MNRIVSENHRTTAAKYSKFISSMTQHTLVINIKNKKFGNMFQLTEPSSGQILQQRWQQNSIFILKTLFLLVHMFPNNDTISQDDNTHTQTHAHRPTFKDTQANLSFLLRWYVSVCLASRVAWRFSDMLCRPNASLVKPAASSSDNLNMINIPLNGWVVHVLFESLLDLVISVHLMLSDHTIVTPTHTTFLYIKCCKGRFTLLFNWINFYKVLNQVK